MFPGPRLPLDWLVKVAAALVLLEVSADRVVVGVINVFGAHNAGTDSNTAVRKRHLRHIFPQERSRAEDLSYQLWECLAGRRRRAPACRFPSGLAFERRRQLRRSAVKGIDN